jgi:hypothetical protein
MKEIKIIEKVIKELENGIGEGRWFVDGMLWRN